MGRVVGKTACYFWHSKSKNKRISWVFPSRKEANKWRDNKYYKFSEFGTLEFFLETVERSRRIKEREVWMRHREGFLDLELRVGKIVYD